MNVSMIVFPHDEPIKPKAKAFRGVSGDFLAVCFESGRDEISMHVPNEHLTAFYALLVDALAPHVDAQRAAELESPAPAQTLTPEDEQLVNLIVGGARIGHAWKVA